MRVLAIETTSIKGSVAVFENSNCLAYASHSEKNQHAELILGLIGKALTTAQICQQDIDIIGVGVGPGTFTGIRIGLSLAAGFQLATNAIAIGVPSLASISQNVPHADSRPRLVILDARREEYFVALYDCVGRQLLAPNVYSQALAAHELSAALQGKDETLSNGCLVLGDIDQALLNELEKKLNIAFEASKNGQGLPDARACARLAQELKASDHPAEPLYLRGANAKRPDLPVSPLLLPRT